MVPACEAVRVTIEKAVAGPRAVPAPRSGEAGMTARPRGPLPAATFAGVLGASSPPGPMSYCETLSPVRLVTYALLPSGATATRRPPSASAPAQCSPAGPAPIRITLSRSCGSDPSIPAIRSAGMARARSGADRHSVDRAGQVAGVDVALVDVGGDDGGRETGQERRRRAAAGGQRNDLWLALQPAEQRDVERVALRPDPHRRCVLGEGDEWLGERAAARAETEGARREAEVGALTRHDDGVQRDPALVL